MTTVTRQPAQTAHQEEPDPRRWIALGVVLTAAFMVLLDVSIVNVAIPSIQGNLRASYAEIELIIALYSLAYALVLITGGRLGDIVGRRRMFMIGMAGFTLASASCGLAQEPTMLVVSRVVQGVMAALMYPQVLSVIQVSFPPRERGAAFGLFGAIIGLATITGPLLGGVLINLDIAGWDWRPIFLVNVPVGIASLLAARALLHESRSPNAPRLDLIGVAVVSVGLFLLVYPLVEGRDAGWPLWSLVSLIASVPVLVAFALFERRKSVRDDSPLVQMRLFRERGFVVGFLLSLIFMTGIPSFFLTISLTLQIGLGYSALKAGLTTIPFAIGSATASANSVRLAPRLGKRVLYVGCLLLIAGMSAVMLTFHVAGTGLEPWDLIPALLVSGVGLGFIIAPLINLILAGIRSADAGSASGVITTAQQVGGAIGIAVVGVIFFGVIGGHSDAVGRELAPQVRQQLTARGLPAAAADRVVLQFQQCFHDRANATDPTATPPSCTPAQRPGTSPAEARAVGVVLQEAGTAARQRDFADSFPWSVLFNVAVFAATGLLFLLMPRPDFRSTGHGGGGGGGH